MEDDSLFDAIGFALVILFTYGLPFILIILGFVIGKINEVRHFKDLAKREVETRHILKTNLRRIPPSTMVAGGGLVVGQAVIATDYFKSITANIRKIFGGEVKSYERLMERARREAILRMVAEAQALGANTVTNIRLETSNIVSSNSRQKASTAAEVLAYGTAIIL